MKRIITILTFILVQNIGAQAQPSQAKDNFTNEKNTAYKVKTYQYGVQPIPQFFKSLVENHKKDFVKMDNLAFQEFCTTHQIDPNSSSNIEKYSTVNILHKLFTCKTASDCSKGEILSIPYMWHWVQPNPRYSIRFVRNKKLLKNTRPPRGFSRYNSYADVDRTPFLFLSDLVHPESKYYSSSCDTFSTFGWCSEREMAFAALTKLLDYEGGVVVAGNHSWSELLVPMQLANGKVKDFIVEVDNTFDFVNWKPATSRQTVNWKKKLRNSKEAKWYNKMARSKSELNKIRKHLVQEKASQRIEKKLVNYLNSNIND